MAAKPSADPTPESHGAGCNANPAKLVRVLTFRDLVFYGVVLITPIAPVPIYGVAQDLSQGHMILTLLFAGAAMMLTAFSYGRMAAQYPQAGSAYVYVGRGLDQRLGFIAGWTMILDYVVLPIVALIQVSFAVHAILPIVPYPAWVTMFAGLAVALNIRGIQSTATINILLLAAMAIIIAAFFVMAARFLMYGGGIGALFSFRPIYDARHFDLGRIAQATSFAALAYIGFDGVTTLAEDVDRPERTVPLATVAVCLFTTLFSCLLVYTAQLVHPQLGGFAHAETAFMEITRDIGGAALFNALGAVIILSSFGAALAGVAAGARILMAMGRDNVLPSAWFARLDRAHNPTNNILLVSVIAWLGALFLSLETAGELLNFGALIGFMGVNCAALRQRFFVRDPAHRNILTDAVVPTLGFLFCLAIWLTLPLPAKVVGSAWLLLGLAYLTLQRREWAAADLDER